MFAQLQPLALVVGAADRAVERVGLARQRLEHKPGDRLAVFEQERDVAAANLQNSPRAGRPRRVQPKPGSKKPA